MLPSSGLNIYDEEQVRLWGRLRYIETESEGWWVRKWSLFCGQWEARTGRRAWSKAQRLWEHKKRRWQFEQTPQKPEHRAVAGELNARVIWVTQRMPVTSDSLFRQYGRTYRHLAVLAWSIQQPTNKTDIVLLYIPLHVSTYTTTLYKSI